jgi:hypothetical protein
MMKELFDNYGAKALRGLTPVNNKAARWATRQVGMKSQGFVPNSKGHMFELFIVTKEEFNSKERETN